MDYLYEQLGPDRFQELSQAIISASFPRVQCFPVRQADGGRDAVVFPETGGFVAFQVKYIENPHRHDAFKRLEEAVRAELHKARRLVERGATAYYVVTNVKGTGTLDAGTMDKFKELLETELGVPADCWWRDSLNRKLDGNYDLKSSYPEIMTGMDALRLMVEHGQALIGKKNRLSVLKPFVQSQYRKDAAVKFKQGKLLENDLVELFIDVPIDLEQVKERPHMLQIAHQLAEEFVAQAGAAALLLEPKLRDHMRQVVIEGAPGQGKSTLAQFACQVYRMSLLGLESELNRLPEHLRPRDNRIPIRVELPQFAAWLGKVNPFDPKRPNDVPGDWSYSLESFLAAFIRQEAGGGAFSIDELRHLMGESPILLVLDGLDEVADRGRRSEVVENIIASIDRLRTNACSLQVVVTSRPSAFIDATNFPKTDFPHLTLSSLTTPLIRDYAERWMSVKGVSLSERAMIKDTLEKKLQQAHMRDLARNPMQLAILLGLIRHLGPSLPEERTRLYTKYVDHYLEREAEKSEAVQKYLPLLLDLHGHIAWQIHAESERGDCPSYRTYAELRSIIQQYLDLTDHNDAPVDALFRGMTERVYFLVSRVEGTYEFEVQPLREYFAARHLYEFDPNPRREGGPDKKARLDAICRSFYWINVVRFYAGFCKRMELGTLVITLEDLFSSEHFAVIEHPTRLTAMLLSDWVFNPLPRCKVDAVDLVLRAVESGRLLQNPDRTSDFSIPSECGGEELVTRCFQILRSRPKPDFEAELLALIKANNFSLHDLMTHWQTEREFYEPNAHLTWLNHGAVLETLRHVPFSQLDLSFVNPDNLASLSIALSARHYQYLETDITKCDILVNGILNGSVTHTWRFSSILDLFSQVFNFIYYHFALRTDLKDDARSLYSIIDQQFGILREALDVPAEAPNETLQKCLLVWHSFSEALQRRPVEWLESLAPWELVVNTLVDNWGERWETRVIATFAAHTKAADKLPSPIGLLDVTIPLCQRTVHARSQANNLEWWQKQFNDACTNLDIMFVILQLFTWASSASVLAVLTELEHALVILADSDLEILLDALDRARNIVTHSAAVANVSVETLSMLPATLSPRLIPLIARTFPQDEELAVYLRFLSEYSGESGVVLDFCQRVAMKWLTSRRADCLAALPVISRTYAQGIIADGFLLYAPIPAIPLEAARRIVKDPLQFPRILLRAADKVVAQFASSVTPRVAAIAEEQRWFDKT